MTELVRIILSLALEPAGKGQEAGIQCVRACCMVCIERRECIHDIIKEFCIDKFVNPENGSDIWVTDLLSHGQHTFYYVDHEDLPEPLCKLIDDAAIKAAVRNRASTSMYYAALRWEWYGEITEDEFQRYGFAMFFADLRPSRQRHLGMNLLSAVPEALRPHFYSARYEGIATRAKNLLRVIGRAFSAETARRVTTNEYLSPAMLSPGLWKVFFQRARSDNEVFLGALAIFTLSLSSARQYPTAPSISEKRWAAAEPELCTRIERSITHHQCGSHPIVVWYREQMANAAIPELATAP
jgi:hypothetical protein